MLEKPHSKADIWRGQASTLISAQISVHRKLFYERRLFQKPSFIIAEDIYIILIFNSISELPI